VNKVRSRRSVLGVAGVVATGSLCGCLGSIPGLGGGDDGGSGPDSADNWGLPRGTAAGTGFSSSGGTGPDAGTEIEAELRDGNRVEGRTFPAVGEDGVYAMARNRDPYGVQPPRFRLYVYRLSRSDGSETWRRILSENQETGGAPHTRDLSGPIVAGDSVYVTWVEGERNRLHVAALATEDGSTKWTKTGAEGVRGTYPPVVHDGTLYLPDGFDRIRALSTDDGSEQWRSRKGLINQRFPVVGDRGVALYNFGSGEDVEPQVTVLDTEDGTERLSAGAERSLHPMLAVVGDTVYLANGGSNGGFEPPEGEPRRAIQAISMEDGGERWRHTYETDAVADAISFGGTSRVTVDGDHVYYALGFPSPYELAPSTPESEREEMRDRMYEGPNVVALDRSDGSVVWETQVGSLARVFRPMAVGPDRLYAQYRGENDDAENRIYVLDRSSGEVLGDFGPVAESNPVAIADGTLYTHAGGVIRAWE
jgi:outer membrane protein assembly factor BamB